MPARLEDMGNLRDPVEGRRTTAAVGDHGGGEGACRGMVMSLGREITTPGSRRSRYRSSRPPMDFDPKSGSCRIALLWRIVGTVGNDPIPAGAFASSCG